MYFVTSGGSRACAVRVEACPMQTLDILQKTPREGPDLPRDRAGNYTSNCCYRNSMYKSELFCIWNLSSSVFVGLHVLYYHKNT